MKKIEVDLRDMERGWCQFIDVIDWCSFPGNNRRCPAATTVEKLTKSTCPLLKHKIIQVEVKE